MLHNKKTGLTVLNVGILIQIKRCPMPDLLFERGNAAAATASNYWETFLCAASRTRLMRALPVLLESTETEGSLKPVYRTRRSLAVGACDMWCVQLRCTVMSPVAVGRSIMGSPTFSGLVMSAGHINAR